MAILQLSHIGVCVSDLAASLRFYCDLLGMRELHRLEVVGPHVDGLLQLEGVELLAVYLERDAVRVELLHYRTPGHTGDATPRPMNQRGLTHLSFRVDDLRRTIDELRAAGAEILDETRVETPKFRSAAVFVLDPDGTRIELVQAPGDPSGLPGA